MTTSNERSAPAQNVSVSALGLFMLDGTVRRGTGTLNSRALSSPDSPRICDFRQSEGIPMSYVTCLTFSNAKPPGISQQVEGCSGGSRAVGETSNSSCRVCGQARRSGAIPGPRDQAAALKDVRGCELRYNSAWPIRQDEAHRQKADHRRYESHITPDLDWFKPLFMQKILRSTPPPDGEYSRRIGHGCPFTLVRAPSDADAGNGYLPTGQTKIASTPRPARLPSTIDRCWLGWWQRKFQRRSEPPDEPGLRLDPLLAPHVVRRSAIADENRKIPVDRIRGHHRRITDATRAGNSWRSSERSCGARGSQLDGPLLAVAPIVLETR
jgi:hypothetical protein